MDIETKESDKSVEKINDEMSIEDKTKSYKKIKKKLRQLSKNNQNM